MTPGPRRNRARDGAAGSGPLLIYCAGVDRDGIEGTDHRLVDHLPDSLDIIWVDPPASAARRLRRRWRGEPVAPRGLTPVRDGLQRLHTVGPPGVTRVGVRSLAGWLQRRAVRRAVDARPGREVVVLASTPDVDLGRMPGGRRVLHLTDDFVAGAGLMGISARRARRVLDRSLAHADHVLAVSPTLADGVRDRCRAVTVLRNGCDPLAYASVERAPAPSDVVLPAPIAGVMGQLNDRLDLRLLEAVADTGASLLLVGPRTQTTAATSARLDALIARPTVQWVGRKPVEDLPGYLGVMTVGLTPYADTEFNRASDPLKTLEYLAAGLPVVTTDLPAAAGLPAEVVTVADTPERFAAGVLDRLRTGRDPAVTAACRAQAQRHSWQSRAAVLDAVLRGAHPREEPR